MSITSLYQSPLAKATASCALLLLALLFVRVSVLPAEVQGVVSDVSNAGLNAADLEMQTRNYYREVSEVNIGRFAGLGRFLTRIGAKPPQDEPGEGEPTALSQTSIVHRENLFLPWELKPSEEIVFQKQPFRTNRWGMRDRDYEKQKPANTFRIALVGASNSMGSRVAVEDVYLERIEERLNAELAGNGYDNYEALNFSVGGYELTDRLFVASEKIPAFEPDLILIVVLHRDLEFAVYQRVAERLVEGVPAHFEFIEQIKQEAGVQPDDREGKILQRLRPFRAKLLRGSAEEMGRLSERLNVPVVAVALNLVVDSPPQMLKDAAFICESAGVTTLRVFDAYEGHTGDAVYISPTDRHPTPLGHQLIADELYQQLMDHPTLGPRIRKDE